LFHSRNAFKVHDQDTLDYGFIVYFLPAGMDALNHHDARVGFGSGDGWHHRIDRQARHYAIELVIN
jgi:hypothetical protein